MASLEPLTSNEAWIEWIEKRDLNACSENTKSQLSRFAQLRLRHWVAEKAWTSRMETLPDAVWRSLGDPDWCWSRLEEHLRAGKKRAGKTYLNSIAERLKLCGDAIAKVAESYMSTVIRRTICINVLRELAPSRKKTDPIFINLDATVDSKIEAEVSMPLAQTGNTESGHTLTSFENEATELLETEEPDGSVSCVQFEVYALDEAKAIWGEASDRQRIVFLSALLELSVADPVVENATGVKHSVISTTRRDLIDSINQRVRRSCDGEDAKSVARLGSLIRQNLRRIALQWGKSEKRCAPLFDKAGD